MILFFSGFRKPIGLIIGLIFFIISYFVLYVSLRAISGVLEHFPGTEEKQEKEVTVSIRKHTPYSVKKFNGDDLSDFIMGLAFILVVLFALKVTIDTIHLYTPNSGRGLFFYTLLFISLIVFPPLFLLRKLLVKIWP